MYIICVNVIERKVKVNEGNFGYLTVQRVLSSGPISACTRFKRRSLATAQNRAIVCFEPLMSNLFQSVPLHNLIYLLQNLFYLLHYIHIVDPFVNTIEIPWIPGKDDNITSLHVYA